MKHSAKLFTALAALALFAVVMVGIQDRGADAQSGGTTGRVYLTNLNSCLTTQPNPPSNLACGDSGRVFVGSGTSLFTTVVEQESESPYDPLNTIARDSDVLIVTVMDSDANISTTGTLLDYHGQFWSCRHDGDPGAGRHAAHHQWLSVKSSCSRPTGRPLKTGRLSRRSNPAS